MITSLALAVSLSCNISVAEQLKTDPLKVDFSVSGIKQSVCTSEQSEVEFWQWVVQQEKLEQERNARHNAQKKK